MRGGGGSALLHHIFQPFWHQFSPPVWQQCWSFLSCITPDEGSLANECMPCSMYFEEEPTATVFPEDVCCACTFRSACASKNCSASTLKHDAFEFERGWPKREGGGGQRHGMSLWREPWAIRPRCSASYLAPVFAAVKTFDCRLKVNKVLLSSYRCGQSCL